MLRNLWHDGRGSVSSAELMLLMTIVCVGMLVGFKSFRDAAVSEFADMAQAVANLNQSYSLPAFPPPGGAAADSEFEDEPDFCDTAEDVDEGQPGSKCVNVCVAAYLQGGDTGLSEPEPAPEPCT